MSSFTKILRLIIGVAILLLVFFKIGISKIASSFQEIRLPYLLLFLLFMLVAFVLIAVNLSILIRAINRKVNFIRLLKSSIMSWSIGLVSLGKIGEFSIAYLLKDDMPVGEGFAVSFMDKALTFVYVIVFSFIALIIFSRQDYMIVLLAVITLSIIGAFLLSSAGFRNMIREKILGKKQEHFKGFSKTLSYILREKKAYLALDLIVTFVKLFFDALTVYVLFLALNVGLPVSAFPYIFMINAIATLISTIPITLAGLGLKELMSVVLYTQLGIAAAVAGAMQVVFLIIKYGIAFVNLIFHKDGKEKDKVFTS